MKRKQSFGGTLLGVVLGLVVGLVAALLVAVYVTKVPVPFLDGKGVGSAAARDASEAKKNKDWDPNAPLAGKPAAVIAPPPAAQTPQLASTTSKTTSTVALPPLDAPAAAGAGAGNAAGSPGNGAVLAKVDPRARGAAGGDPLGDLARARSGADSGSNSVVTSPGEPYAYFVQAGAFRGATEADAQRAKLAIMGWEAQVTEREQAGRTMFRVRIGPYARKDDAERIKERLDDAGLQAALVRVQR